MADEEPTRCGVCRSEVALKKDGTVRQHGRCTGGGERPLMTQYGVQWGPGKPVMTYGSRSDTERQIKERSRGVLMFHEGIPGQSSDQWTPWAPVEADEEPA